MKPGDVFTIEGRYVIEPAAPELRGTVADIERYVFNDCSACIEHYAANPMIAEAFASVGISRNKSSGEMAREFYHGYHARGHRE